MTNIVWVKRGDKEKVDSRQVLDVLGLDNHKQWMYKYVFKDVEGFEAETGDELEVDYERNKRGKPTKFAWFTEKQVYFVIAKARNTIDALDAKKTLAQMFANLRQSEKENKTKMTTTTVWQDRLNKIAVPVMNDSKVGEVQLFSPQALKHIENKFSPDEKFIQFLSNLEAETGYILPWNFDFGSCGILTYPPEYKSYIDTYRKITEIEDARYICMWGSEELPALPDEEYLVPANDIPPTGGVWLDETRLHKEVWQEIIECVKDVVEAYNDPQRKEKYGIPSQKELETDYENLEQDTIFLTNTLQAYNRFQEFNEETPKVLGFQVHKDWLLWLESDNNIASAMRKFYLGSSAEVFFSITKEQDEDGDEYYKTTPGSFVIVYPFWANIKDGKSWYTEMEPNPEYNPDAPLFQTVRFYDEKYEPLFDWYLENIWLPQHSLKFFQATDPKGYPQLAMLLADLPSNTNLPKMFLKAAQKQLAASQS
jgi:Zn-finger nucleic acid-binding protein